MLEILHRGGLGRTAEWQRGGRSLALPIVLFVDLPSRRAPDYAEVLFVPERTQDPRPQIRGTGSLFPPQSPGHPDHPPPTKALSASMPDPVFPPPPPVA